MNFKRLLLPMLILFVLPVLFVPVLNDLYGSTTSATDSNSNKVVKQLVLNEEVKEILENEIVETEKPQLNQMKKQNPFKYVTIPTDKQVVDSLEEGIIENANKPSQNSVANQNTPEVKTQEVEKSTTQPLQKPVAKYNYSDEEFELLAALVSIEGYGSGQEVKTAIASVVLNRMDSSSFPNNIKEIIYSKNQFLNTTINALGKTKPTEEDYLAVIEALNGKDDTLGAEYYYSKQIVKYSEWHEKKLHLTKEADNFRFFSKDQPQQVDNQPKQTINIVSQGAKVEVSEPSVSIANENVDSSIKNDKVEEVKTLNNVSKGGYIAHTEEEFEMLAKIIWAEARGESYEGKVAVGAVILNRLESPKYPNSIKEIIFAPKQFEPVSNGSFVKAKPTAEEYLAAVEAFNGVDPTKGATSFYAPSLVRSEWHESLTYTTTIGVHRFFK